jgi:hypothetical protein
MHYRMAPGEGEFIAGFSAWCTGPAQRRPYRSKSSDELDDLPVQTAAERLATADRRVLSRMS